MPQPELRGDAVPELIRPIEQRRLYQQIADRIRELIQHGDFQPSTRLPAERELAQTLGVSRPSLREALIALEIDGSVEIRMGSGIYVSAGQQPAPPARSLGESPSEIMQARIAGEGTVAVMACIRMTPETLAALRELLGSMRATIEAGRVPLEQDREFHVLLASQAGNSVLTRLVGELFDGRQGMILAKLSTKFENSGTWRIALAEHDAILSALDAMDVLRVEAAMRTHLHNSAERWLGD